MRGVPWIVVLAIGCGGRTPHEAPSSRGGANLEVTLYRDHAVVAQRVQLVIPPASTTTIRVKVAAGVSAEDVYVVDKSELTVRDVRAVGASLRKPVKPADPCADSDPCAELVQDPPPPDDADSPEAPATPTEVELVIGGPREGSFTLAVGYDTERITWDTAYTMTTTAARDHAVLRGAIAIRNATGLALRNASVWVVDADHGPATGRVAERLGHQLVQVAADGIGKLESSTPLAVPRELGRVDLVDGDTRIELLPSATPRPMRSVLVYDPIGAKLDHAGSSPVRDSSLGVHPPPSSRVTESFEIARDPTASVGLPAGPVRLLERRGDGSLALLGEARMFDAATRVAVVDAVAIGTADGVTGKRERRELTIDDDHKRIVEEFVITIENTRARPVEVVIREHFYRGQNWTLAYQSVPLGPEAKEGSQQVAMRLIVPPKQLHKPGQSQVLYVVVYTWP